MFQKAVLGIEFGSTRVKAILLDENHMPVAAGNYEWENRFENGYWTYSFEEICAACQACYADLKRDVKEKFGVELTRVAAIGISGMMHGYLPFDEAGNLLVPFRTWRNTTTGEAAQQLTELFDFNIPQRWSVAHLYQAVLNEEAHLSQLRHLTTLAGYIHWRLTGQWVMGIGEASGMFPIDSSTIDYDDGMLQKFEKLLAPHGFPWQIRDVLPSVLAAGEHAGYLTREGARFLDPSGTLQAGIPIAPCEGDAGTGMVATNSVRVYTGNVSAGTSDFAMVVVDKQPGVHMEIDMVTTPAGKPVAMVHCNNCTSDINAWAGLFGEFAAAMGFAADKGALFAMLFKKAMEGELDCGGLLSYNYLSGESITGFDEGRPLFIRRVDSRFTLANFMRMHLLSALASLKIGLDILTETEKIRIDKLYGHGGFFKTPEVGQRILSAAVNAPVSVMESAGEGGSYGMALLASYMINKNEEELLEDFLDQRIFAQAASRTVMATLEEIAGFAAFLRRYRDGLVVERTAVEHT